VVTLTRLDSAQPDFQARLARLLQFDDATDASIEQTVATILHDVKTRGDAAVLEYTARFDRLPAVSLASLELNAAQLTAALDQLPADTRQALEAAAARVRRYHEKQVQGSWTYTEDDGTVLGQKITPLDRVGLYVPGGKAAYPSSVLMNAIPAKVAGVGRC
jgi:histidinol dehydrogenase